MSLFNIMYGVHVYVGAYSTYEPKLYSQEINTKTTKYSMVSGACQFSYLGRETCFLSGGITGPHLLLFSSR